MRIVQAVTRPYGSQATVCLRRGSRTLAADLQPRVARRGGGRGRACVCLAPGVSVTASRALNDNRVRVLGGKTELALEDGLEELGRSVEFPKFKRGRRNAPLPTEMLVSVLGQSTISKYVVDKLAVDTVCDHAAESGRLVRTDLSADMALCELEAAYAAFEGGKALRLTLEYDFMERPS